MALNTLKCDRLMPLRFKGITVYPRQSSFFTIYGLWATTPAISVANELVLDEKVAVLVFLLLCVYMEAMYAVYSEVRSAVYEYSEMCRTNKMNNEEYKKLC